MSTYGNLVELKNFVINTRSFHPNKKFELQGFRFHGDNRGFSLKPSFFDPQKEGTGLTTSRIWSKFRFSSDTGKILFKDCQSNTSDANHVLGQNQTYENQKLKPQIKVRMKDFQKMATLVGGEVELNYYGENFAFLGSELDKKTLNTTIVPSLDVTQIIGFTISRFSKTFTLYSLIYGDGFPNCESFMEDHLGNKIFIGSHVRFGNPLLHLFGGNERIMTGVALTIDLNEDGSFGNSLTLHGRFYGGSPKLRESYPFSSGDEYHHVKNTVKITEVPLVKSAFMWWKYKDNLEKVGNSDFVFISAYEKLGEVKNKLIDVIQEKKKLKKYTVNEWNEAIMYNNPNEGRSRDSEDLSDSKWKK